MHIPMLVYVLVTAHLVGDWLLQSNAMALGKSKNTWEGLAALTKHCVVVLAVLSTALSGWALTADVAPNTVTNYLLVNFAAHWVTDFLTSRFNASKWFVSCLVEPTGYLGKDVLCTMQFDPAKRFWFWRGIGSDQWIHYVTLFATAEWLLL